MNSGFAPNPPPTVFGEPQPSNLEDALGMTTIQLLISIKTFIIGRAKYEHLTRQASRLIRLFAHEEFRISSDPAITRHLAKLKDLGSDVLRAVDHITSLVATHHAQSGVLRMFAHGTYLIRLGWYKQQLDMAVGAFRVHSVYEARHRVLELVIERFRDLITDIRNVILRHLKRRRRATVRLTWFAAPTVSTVEELNGQGPPGVTQPVVSHPHSHYSYSAHPSTPPPTQPTPSMDPFGPPPSGVHLTINIGSGNTTNSTLRNIANDHSEVHVRRR